MSLTFIEMNFCRCMNAEVLVTLFYAIFQEKQRAPPEGNFTSCLAITDVTCRPILQFNVEMHSIRKLVNFVDFKTSTNHNHNQNLTITIYEKFLSGPWSQRSQNIQKFRKTLAAKEGND